VCRRHPSQLVEGKQDGLLWMKPGLHVAFSEVTRFAGARLAKLQFRIFSSDMIRPLGHDRAKPAPAP
jgi:hypothetical protein